ncbi:MAG: hypothetical protein ACF8GE_01625 [Phycisphaerales bacterium JB043]
MVGGGLATAAVCALPGGRARAQDSESGSLPSEAVREFVLVAHQRANFESWKGMLERMPALVNATMDWRHGDWETALGAAAHMGFPEHAEFLLAHGARMDCFCAAMLGHVNVVRAMVEADERVPFVLGPHGFSLMHHARQGKAEAVQEYLHSIDANDGMEGWTYEREEFYRGAYVFPSGARVEVRKEESGYVFAHSELGELRPQHMRAHAFKTDDEMWGFRMTCVGAWGLEMQRDGEREVGIRQ